MRRGAVSGVVLVVVLTMTRPGYADDEQRVRLHVEAPCVDADELWRRIGARTRRVVRAGAGETAQEIAITISNSPSGAIGTLRIGDDARASLRRVEGRSCDGVADALALAVALAFDPIALGQPPPSAAPPARDTGPAPALAPLMMPPPASRFAVGGHASIMLTDETPVGGDLFGQIAKGRSESLAIRTSISIHYAYVGVAPTAARFLWVVAVPEVCPLRFAAGPIAIVPCAGVAIGTVWAEATGASRRAFGRPSIAPRVTLRAAIPISPRLALEVQGSVEAPLVRARYSFGSAEIYATPLVASQLGAGASYAFDDAPRPPAPASVSSDR